jgi:transposase
VCIDETNRQLIGEIQAPRPVQPGQAALYDYEYVRNGVANLFMMFEPLAGQREVMTTEQRTKIDFARCLRYLAETQYPDAEKIVLVMDNLNTHSLASLYAAFEPEVALRLAQRFEIHFTPKHGSWVNMAELEIGVMSRQCLGRRIAAIENMASEVKAWVAKRNDYKTTVHWQFATPDARIKLRHLYPKI